MSLQTLRARVGVSSLTDSILQITASGASAAQAETTANAVAGSYVGYVTSGDSPVGYVPAKILQAAASATGFTVPEQVAIDGLLGALAGVIAGFVATVAIGRNDRRLTERDAIANSIGAPVLASIPVRRPSDPESWAKLLEEYGPGAVHGWALRNLLRQLAPADNAGGSPAYAGLQASGGKRTTLTVLSLSTDPRALALGPQLAVFAASLGIPTALIIGPQQDADAVAALRTACAAPQLPAADGRRPRLVVADDGQPDQPGTALSVVVMVIDGQAPRMPAAVRTAATVLGVSAGGATAEELARAATAAATDGRDILGILVADPDPSDQTTGRIPRMVAQVRRPLPTRVKDVATEITR